MDIARELALRSDAEIQQALNRMIKGSGALKPELAVLMASPEDMRLLIESIEPRENIVSSVVQLGHDARAVRAAVLLAAEDPTLRPAVEAALAQDRKTRDPLTIALALAGIVLVLSTKFEMEYGSENGKKKFRFKIKKDATPNSILKKFFGLFGGS